MEGIIRLSFEEEGPLLAHTYPPPDLNPIEQVFAKFKTLLRKAGARSYEAVCQASAQILAQYRPEECAAYIRNAGYA